MSEAILSSKNQIVLPSEARRALGVHPGDKVLVLTRGGAVTLMRKPKSYVAAIRGIGAGLYPPRYLQAERDAW